MTLSFLIYSAVENYVLDETKFKVNSYPLPQWNNIK